MSEVVKGNQPLSLLYGEKGKINLINQECFIYLDQFAPQQNIKQLKLLYKCNL